MNRMQEKINMRKQMLDQRSELKSDTKLKFDKIINDKLIDHVISSNARRVHVYLPIKNEINIFPFISWLLTNDRIVIAPKVLPERELQNLRLNSLRETEAGVFGTYHPAGNDIYTDEFDLIVTPGLAFDTANNRLGYGGGYYDRFLIKHPSTLTIGIHYPFQLLDKIPIESHDVRLHNLLTIT